MGKVRTAFNALEFEDGFSLKDNLRDNLRFIFGPPGTGKTTTLANKIVSKMNENQGCKILVLAPTNTACDEPYVSSDCGGSLKDTPVDKGNTLSLNAIISCNEF